MLLLSALLLLPSVVSALQSGKASTALNAEMSRSVPFLLKPKNTAGWVADAEFDPLGLSDSFDIKWMREAEIKHGRAAMLATVGFVVQEYWSLPGYPLVADSNQAPAAVGLSSMLQWAVGCGIYEYWTNKGNITMENMFSDPARVPGKFGFDPMGLSKGKTPEEMAKWEQSEIENGRLAMLAIGGMIHHNWVTGGPLF